MRKLRARWWFLATLVLAAASAAALALLSSSRVTPSALRDPLSGFVQPGITVWWFVLGGPFRSVPATISGIAFTALVNELSWLVALWLVLFTLRMLHRKMVAPRS